MSTTTPEPARRSAPASADWCVAYAPATVANFGPGFDVLGLAVEAPGDEVAARPSATAGVRLQAASTDVPIPLDPQRNTAAVAAAFVLERARGAVGVDLVLRKGLPIGSGLGSSGASAVAAAVATNEALGAGLDLPTLLQAAMRAEGVACGAAHGDNVAPALYGGIVLLDPASDPPAVLSLPVPEGLRVALVTPAVEVRTADARAALPTRISLEDAVWNASQLARLVDALHRGDLRALAAAMHDRLHVPSRSKLIPHYRQVEQRARAAGALAVTVSGSGPTVCALCPPDPRVGETVADAMRDGFEREGLSATAWTTRAGVQGARCVARGPLTGW